MQKFTLHAGDCLEVMAGMEENSVDAVVCDPPYHLTSVVKRFGKTNIANGGTNEARARAGADGYARFSRGFMGQVWDGGDIAFRPETWEQVFRVLKPGGHLLAFSGTRTYHRMACAIEDAGFEIREMHAWVFGSGFPKSLNIAKQMEAKLQLGSSRPEDVRRLAMGDAYTPSGRGRVNYDHGGASAMNGEPDLAVTEDAARAWQGWGTATKPALEPICVARKPLSERTVAENVLRWGTGALNIDATRIAPGELRRSSSGGMGRKASPIFGAFARPDVEIVETTAGRWPANLCHDGSDEVLALFPESSGSGKARVLKRSAKPDQDGWGMNKNAPDEAILPDAGEGSAARFFYQAKASAKDRVGSKHPTVKPVALMRWLVRLVTPPNGVVLDPFAGTGTTGQAALEEGFRAVLIEREEEYRADIARRMAPLIFDEDF